MKKTFLNPDALGAGMTKGSPLYKMMALLFAFILAAGAPGASLAMEEGELEGEITIGVQNFDIDHMAAEYGKYTGVDDKGTFAVGELELEYGKDLFYLEIEGKDLGLDNRGLTIEAGNLGGYELELRFSQLPWLISSDAKTIYDGAGSNELTLPAGFKTGNETQDMLDSMQSAAKDIKLRVDRTTAEAEFEIPFGGFLVEVNYRSDKRDGEMPLFGALGTSGGNNRAVDLPAPVDYTTNDMSIALFWKCENAFAKADFAASTFDNANEYVTWDNPFPTNVRGVNYPERGRTSLPPSNTYQRFGISGGLNDLPMNSTLSLRFDSASGKQDNDLMPYSFNSNSTVNTGLPRSSAQAQIDVTTYALNINSKPVDNLGVRLEYSNYTTDNKTPKDLFIYIPLDSGVVQDGTNGGHALYNLPVDHSKTDMKLDLTYSLMSTTKFKVGYLNEVVERSYREVAKSIEDRFSAGLDSRFSMGKIALNYQSSSRKIDGHYEEAAVYDAYHSHDYVTGQNPATAFDDHPAMRKFDIAERDRTKTGATLILWPSPTVNATLGFSATEDKYGESEFGLTNSKWQSITADVSVMPSEMVTLFLFYASDAITSEQASRYYRGGGSKASMSVDPGNNWWATHEDTTPTISVGAVMTLMDELLDVGAYYTTSDATTAITFKTGKNLEVVPLPDLKTKFTSIDVTARYRYSDAITVGLGYALETYEVKNWSLNDVEPASDVISEVLTMVPIEPDYTGQRAMIFITWALGK